MKFSIVVPCYNESRNIPLILKRFQEVISRDDVEVLLVNNGSTDDSRSVFERIIGQYAFAKVVEVKKNQGYGFGVLSGLKEAKGDYIGWTHADMQTDPKDVIRGFEIIEEVGHSERIYVKGKRSGRALLDTFFTVGMGIFESIYLGSWMFDINAQPNIFPKSFYLSWKNPPHDFALDLYAFYSAKKAQLKIVRFPVLFPERIHGHSHWNFGWKSKIKFIKRTIDFSLKLKRSLASVCT